MKNEERRIEKEEDCHFSPFFTQGKGDLDDVSGIVFDRKTGNFLLIEDSYSFLTTWNEKESIIDQVETMEGDFEDVTIAPDGTVFIAKTNGDLVCVEGFFLFCFFLSHFYS